MLDVYAALLGLVTGSYLNVVIHRLPRGESTVLPRSRCPYCGGGIRSRDNLPVLSYLLLRGRCRRCGAPISWRYPAFEALTALLFVGVVERFGLTPEALVALVFGQPAAGPGGHRLRSLPAPRPADPARHPGRAGRSALAAADEPARRACSASRRAPGCSSC